MEGNSLSNLVMSKMDYHPVKCAECGVSLMRRTWNPEKRRAILFSFCDMARSEEWKKAVKFVWARSDAKCERCGKDHRAVADRKRDAFDIHHIISFQYRPLRTDPSNLVLLCEPCHYWVHSRRNVNREFLSEAPV